MKVLQIQMLNLRWEQNNDKLEEKNEEQEDEQTNL